MGRRGTVLTIAFGVLSGVTACGGIAPLRSAQVAAPAKPTSTTTAGVVAPAATLANTLSAQPDPSTAAATPGPAWLHHSSTRDGDSVPRPAWVSVPVLTVWDRPDLVRTVDAPVLGPEPLVRQWVAAMDFGQKLDLGQRVATQALLDDPLTVLGLEGEWAHVLVDDQTGSVYPNGIEGWVPRAQLSFAPVHPASTPAEVISLIAKAGGVELSYGTRVSIVGSTPDSYAVSTFAGVLNLPKASVHLGPLPASGAEVVKQAAQFLGLPYLWAGTSAYGFDCSGLTYAVYRQFGISLARDAADQALQGTPVQRSALRPGDLVFFAAAGAVHHVAIYAGDGLMLDAPETGGRTEVVPLWGTSLSGQYVGARRYIG